MTKTEVSPQPKKVLEAPQDALPMSDEVVNQVFEDIANHEDNQEVAKATKNILDERTPEQYDTRLERMAAKLGRFAAKISIGASSLRDKASYMNARATTGALHTLSSATEVAQKGFEAYRKPLDKMEAKKDDSKSKKTAKFIGRSAYRMVVAGGIAGLAFTTKNIAEAASITVNGHQGGASNAFNDTVAHSTLGKGDKNVPVRWSAEMGDLPIFPQDKLSTLESTDEGAMRIAEVVAQNPGKNTLLGYSEGGIAVAKYLQDNPDYLAKGNEVVFVGSPYVPGQRMGDHPFLELVKPLLPDTAKVLEYETPGGQHVTHIVREDDFVKLKDNPIGMLAALDPKGHYYSPADLSGHTPHITVRNEDGSTSMILTETHTKLADGSNARSGISAALVENNNLHVSRKADNFFEALDGEPLSGKINAGEVTRTGAAAAEEALVSNGINPDHARVVKDVIEHVPAQPIQALFDGVSNLPGAISSGMTSGGAGGGGQQNLNQIVDTLTGNYNPEPAPAAPAPVAPAPVAPVWDAAPAQIQQPVQQIVEQAAPVVKQVEAAVPQLAPQIQQGKDLLGQFGVRIP